MKIDTVILSSNDNKDYLDFWPIVSEAWSNFGVEPILIYTGEEDINLSGNIVKLNSKKINSAFLAQNIRLLFPGILNNRTCIISDIDNLPLSKDYFVIEKINFLCFKYISDQANETASNDWNQNLSNAGEAFRKYLESLNG